MTTWLCLLAVLLQDDLKTPEQKARDRGVEMRLECAAALAEVDGVGTVGLGGTGTDYRLLIVVRNAATQKQVRELIGGDEYGGLKIVWSIADPERRPPPPPPEPFAEKPRMPPPQPEPFSERANPWNAAVTDCDIIRDYLKLKRVSHPSGNGMSWVPCQVLKRTQIGPGGGHSFSYTNHRPDCPVRLGRVGEPPWSDAYIAWVFRQGITPATGTNFTIPSDGWAWAAQVAADMASRLPNVREGAGAYGWPTPYPYPDYYPYPYYPYRYFYWRPRWHCHWSACRGIRFR